MTGSPSSRHSDPAVTVFLPTRNGGAELATVLRLVQEQELDRSFEILVIDSGSTDGTIELLERAPLRLLRIPRSEFNHGLTRQRAVEEARGEIVAMLVQDAQPADRRWLQALVEPFSDAEVAGVYSRQIPRPDANPFIRRRLGAWAAASLEPRIQSIESPAAFETLPPLERMSLAVFDNVSSAVRRSVALEIPFDRKQFGEDIDWGRRVVLAGHELVYEPRSAVVHSHDRSAWYELRRIYLDHQNLHRTFGVHTVPDLESLIASLRWEVRENLAAVAEDSRLNGWRRLGWRLRSLPHACAGSLGQYLGARSVRPLERSRWLPGLADRLLRRGI
jgi:rhamnosyltransferase